MRWRCGLLYPDLMHQRNEIKLAMSHTYTHIQLWYQEGHLCLCSLKCWKIATLTCNLCSEKSTPHLRASPQRVGWVHAWRASGSVRNQARSASVCWEKLMCASIVFCLLLIFPIYMMKKKNDLDSYLKAYCFFNWKYLQLWELCSFDSLQQFDLISNRTFF